MKSNCVCFLYVFSFFWMLLFCWQESSEETELRAALAASITDTHFQPVCFDVSDSDGNDTDVSEIPDDEEPAYCSSGSGAVVPDADSCLKTSQTSNSKKLKIETTTLHDNSADSDNCGGSLHQVAEVESPISDGDRLVPSEEQKPGSWKDFTGPESGNY